MNDSLPSAEYARSKMPTAEEIRAAEQKLEALERERIQKLEEHARFMIRSAYKKGKDSFVVYNTCIPDSVQDEMRKLGWEVVRRYEYTDCIYGFTKSEYKFTLPPVVEQSSQTNE